MKTIFQKVSNVRLNSKYNLVFQSKRFKNT